MAINVTYRANGAVVPTTTTTKNAALLNSEIDGNIKSIVESIEALYVPNSGTTSTRPTIGVIVGYMYFDTTINKPVWWNGTVWKDAAGTNV